MKTTILFTIVMLCLFCAGKGLAQETISTDPDREVLVLFKENLVNVPMGPPTGALSQFDFTSDTLRQTLQQAGVEFMGRLIADFKPEDRIIQDATGRTIVLSDWTNTYLIRIPNANSRPSFIKRLKELPGVVYAEPNGLGEHDALELTEKQEEAISEKYTMAALIPNDQHFNRQWAHKNDGTSLQGSGTPGADMKTADAWSITNGSSSVKIGIVDNGMQTDHTEFSGRVTGDPGYTGTDCTNSHGTCVAGVAAAQGNNVNGIAGVAWNVGIINEDYGAASDADFSNAVRSASTRGAHVINNSWKLVPVGRYSTTVRRAFADVYKQNRVAVASMGNQATTSLPEKQYPAAFGQGILTAGASTNTDQRADYSSRGSWIDVVAPGGGKAPGIPVTTEDWVYVTYPGSTYGYTGGTSFAAPAVSGLAGLLLSYNASLYNDDIEHLIQLSTDKVSEMSGQNFTNEYGYGRVNAHQALLRLQSPYVLNHYTATGGAIHATSSQFSIYLFDAPGIPDGLYRVKRREIRKTVTFPYMDEVEVWGRGVATTGWNKEENPDGTNRNFALGYCEVVPGTVTSTSAVLRTYIYEVKKYNSIGQLVTNYGWQPVTEGNVEFAYTVHGIPGTPPLVSAYLGLNTIPVNTNNTWTAASSGGTTPYSYVWDRKTTGSSTWTYLSNSSSLTLSYSTPQTFDLRLKTTDSNLNADYEIKLITIYDNPNCQDPSYPCKVVSRIPEEFRLENNYPNPFNPSTKIAFSLPEMSDVRINVYNINGQLVSTLLDETRNAGSFEIDFDAANLSSGFYIARMTAVGSQSGQRFANQIKMQLIK